MVRSPPGRRHPEHRVVVGPHGPGLGVALVSSNTSARPLAIDVVFPNVDQPFNGIGDHTRTLVAELIARGHSVRVIHNGPDRHDESGFDLVGGWPGADLRDTRHLRELVAQRSSDALILQFEQFSYGTRGYNPTLARLFADLRRESPGTRRVLFAHETYPDPTTPGKAAMWSYQRTQILALAREADSVLASCSKVFLRLKHANPRTYPVPVHSNIPREPLERLAERARWGLSDEELVVMVFGHLDPIRSRWIAGAFARISEHADARLLYVGKASAAAASLTSERGRMRVIENAPPRDVSSAMASADLALAPFRDGVSGRRGSFAAYMEHEVPTITNAAPLTDEYLRTAAAVGAFRLAVDEQDFADLAEEAASDFTVRDDIRRRIRQSFASWPSRTATADAVEIACAR